MSYFQVLLRRLSRAFHFKKHWYLTRAGTESQLPKEQAHVMLALQALANKDTLSESQKLKRALASAYRKPNKADQVHIYYSLELSTQEYRQATTCQTTRQLLADNWQPLKKLTPADHATENSDSHLFILYKVSETGKLQVSSAQIKNQCVDWCKAIDANEFRQLDLPSGIIDPCQLRTFPNTRKNRLLVLFEHIAAYLHKQNKHKKHNQKPFFMHKHLKESLAPIKQHHSCFRQFRSRLANSNFVEFSQMPQETLVSMQQEETPLALKLAQQKKLSRELLRAYPEQALAALNDAFMNVKNNLTRTFSGIALLRSLDTLYSIAATAKQRLRQADNNEQQAYRQLLAAYYGGSSNETLLDLHKALGEQQAYELYYTAHNLQNNTQANPFNLKEHAAFSPEQFLHYLAQFTELMLGFVSELERILAERELYNRYEMEEQTLNSEELKQLNQVISSDTLSSINAYLLQKIEGHRAKGPGTTLANFDPFPEHIMRSRADHFPNQVDAV